MKSRIQQFVFIITFIGFCWLTMQVVHELGHIFSARISGGQVEKVVLQPLTFSRTDVSSNPHPLIQIWGGPIVGITLPMAIMAIAYFFHTSYLLLFRFFAGFCCVANGAYIGFGPNSPGLDTQVMLSLGCERWQLMLFGLPMLVLGLYFLNGTGKIFGLGVPGGKVNMKFVWASTILFVSVTVFELIFNNS
jgi:hypothetical protein